MKVPVTTYVESKPESRGPSLSETGPVLAVLEPATTVTDVTHATFDLIEATLDNSDIPLKIPVSKVNQNTSTVTAQLLHKLFSDTSTESDSENKQNKTLVSDPSPVAQS